MNLWDTKNNQLMTKYFQNSENIFIICKTLDNLKNLVGKINFYY